MTSPPVRDRVKRVRINTAAISDEGSFHAEFKRALGFPKFYGANWDAWIDCMSSISFREHGMSSVTVAENEAIVLEIPDSDQFRARCPDEYRNLIECTAAVNRGDLRIGKPPAVLLQFE